MNRGRVALILGAAVLLGLLASAYVYRQLSRAAAMQQAHRQTRQVIVAAKHLPPGTRLQAGDLRYIAWPEKSGVAGMFTEVNACLDRTLMSAAEENEPILEAKLAPAGSVGGLSGVIPEGMRAVSVAVNDVIGVAGFVQPGTMVDVLVTGTPSGTQDRMTRTILEGIRVLAAGQKIEQDPQGQPQTVPVVTLLVTPGEADLLALASVEGRIQLALRNTVDGKKLEPPAVSEKTLFGSFAAAAQPAKTARLFKPRAVQQEPEPYSVVIVRGGKREVATLPRQ